MTTPPQAYLAELERQLADVEPGVRDELVEGIREELAGLDETDAAARLRALGDPAFVAASARAEAAAPKPTQQPKQDAAWYSVVTVLLGSIGGFVVPFLGWVVGLVMLWMAASWRLHHKVVGTVLTIAGPAGLMLVLLPAYGVGVAVDPLIPPGSDAPWWVFALVGAVAWLAGWIWLLVAAERARRR
ncbi:MAG: hypothetical protein DI534_12785 [Leifsonia xyli]|nr:MAG: hypothetical protein DI534_12785 [Leifsonia xyli]